MFLDFAIQNWYLFAMLAVILLVIAFDPAGRAVGGARKVSPMQLPLLQSRQSAVLVDIRTKDEFTKGHIAQSINLPLDTLGDNLNKLTKHKDKPLILICATGVRAGKAASILKKNEFADLHMLDGGLAAWGKENLPLTTS